MPIGLHAGVLYCIGLLGDAPGDDLWHSILNNLYWAIPTLIVLICVGLGYRDMARLRLGRILAIADACYTESIRKKVLLVTPLAILGLIVVVQLQQPATEQDAIRQTTRFCLFASGLLVAVTAIILACTNLPREIENRVIYTIVTKPTTRLEIVIGKVVGFAAVSAAILLIMGVFTYGYLQLRNWQLVGNIDAELKTLPADSPLRPTLAYYASSGLLTTRSLDQPASLQIYSRAPGDETDIHYAGGGVGNYFSVPFDLTADQVNLLLQAQQVSAPLMLLCNFQIVQHPPSDQQWKDIKMLGLRPPGGKPSDVYGPSLPTTQNAKSPALFPVPQVQVRILDGDENPITDFGQIDGRGIDVPGTGKPGYLHLKPELVDALLKLKIPRFYVEFTGVTPAVEYGVKADSVSLYIPNPHDPSTPLMVIHSTGPIDFQARSSSHYGMQLISRPDGSGPVADYHFAKVTLPEPAGDPDKADVVPFELTAVVERGGEFDPHGSTLSRMSVQIFNRTTGQTSEQIVLTPELGRANYVDIPRAQLVGGDFDLLVRGLSHGELLDLKIDSAALITANHSFAFNLFKSLFILWMLSVLVVVIAVFCSTFLSWPIAVVLTLIILLGHWGVNELGDAMKNPGRSISTDFQLRDPVSSKVVSTSVDDLADALEGLATVLPDVSKFPVMEDIERNVSIPMERVEEALGVLLMFGLPMLLLSYVILKNKEVAP
jgi:ABC-type transport system involved in multi-copper enzyme maturation permease subunit